MNLPNSGAFIVDIEKIRDYCLSRRHPRGQHKARVFLSVLGMTDDHSEELRAALIDAALEGNATFGASDQYGSRYIIDFELNQRERAANIRSCWIVRSGEIAPRFVTCFVLWDGEICRIWNFFPKWPGYRIYPSMVSCVVR
jgi:hypothetical protein